MKEFYINKNGIQTEAESAYITRFETMTDEEKAEQLAKAEDALAQIQAGTTTIEKLAETLSLTSTANETYGAGESLAGEEFEATMSALKDGEVAAEVIKTEDSYIVAKLVAYTDEEATAAQNFLLVSFLIQSIFIILHLLITIRFC